MAMTPRHLARVLIERWKLLFVCIAIALIAATASILTTKPLYKSTATVVAGVRAPETIGPQSVAEQLSGDYLLTQEDILRSDRVAQQVVSSSGLASAPGAASRFKWTPRDGSLPQFIARKLRASLLVESSAVNSRVMQISFLSGDPRFAASMANAFADAFIDVNVQLQGDPARRTIASYTTQLDELSRKLQQMQSELGKMEADRNIVASKGEVDPESTRLGSLSSALAQAQAQSVAVSSRAAMSAMPDTMASPVVQSLQTEISRLEGQKDLLAATAGPNNPDLRQLQSQIDSLRSQLRSQEGLIRQTALAAARQAKLAETGLSGAMSNQRDRVAQVRTAQNEISVLQQDIANVKTAYDQINQRRTQLQVLDNTGQTNISLLSPGMESDRPVAPRRLLTLMMALFGGGLIGIVIALGMELLDRRIRFSSEIESWLGIADLGSIRLSAPPPSRLPRLVAGLLPGPKDE
ncbi:MAG: GNVR domain-containing protein [Sphingobium sp.]